MNDIEFFKNFSFNRYEYHGLKNTDNTSGVNLHYIGYMLKGRGIITTANQTVELFEGDMFYIPKRLKYRSEWIGENNGLGNVELDSIGFLYFPTIDSDGYVLGKIDYTDDEFELFKPLSESKDVNIDSIGRMYSFLGKIQCKLKKSTANRCSETVERVLQYMNADHTLTIPEYAGLCGISESLLYHYFKEYSNETPNDARQRIACEKAKIMLSTSNVSIETICDTLSFSSASYFRKTFYKHTGKTPSEVRKESKIF